MWATNSALTWGMHHSCFCHGLRAFFSGAAAPSRGIGRVPPQLHHLARQKTQGPVFMPFRRVGAGHAMRWASPRSSSFRHRWAWGRSCSTPSPASAKRRLVRYTVPSATSRASASWGALHPASVLSRIRARMVTRAAPFPARTRRWSWFRCQPDSILFPDHTATSQHHFPESG